MQVDRSRFLLLAAGIAGACATRGQGDAPQGPVAVASVSPVADDEPLNDPDAVELTPDQRGMAEEQGTASSGDDGKLAAQCREVTPPGPSCESFHATIASCERYGEVMEPKAAKAATRCITRMSGKAAICQFNIAADCFLAGARSATKSRAAQKPCSGALKRCASNRYADPDLNRSNCEAAYSAVKAEHQPRFISCVAEGCGVANCLYQLR